MKSRMTLSEVEQLKNTAGFIKENLHRKLRLSELCSLALMNRHRLNECFQKLYGKNIFEFIRAERMQKARELLQQTDDPLHIIADAVGYEHTTNFASAFKRYYGHSPGEERKE